MKCTCGFTSDAKWILCRFLNRGADLIQIEFSHPDGDFIARSGEYLSTPEALDLIVKTAQQHDALPHFHFSPGEARDAFLTS